MSRSGIDRLIGLVALALMVVLPIPALAQPTQALVENWRDTDFGFNSSMLDTNVDGDAYVLGSNAATNILIDVPPISVTVQGSKVSFVQSVDGSPRAV
jgi:hypothetical protein